MEVYKFNKCFLDRFGESLLVLSGKEQIINASQVRREWSYFIELQIEPTGWQALWKIPRVVCEELKLRFPTVVFGYVENVLFRDLKAIFLVQAVQDEMMHLPERHEVALEDLWPTQTQENSELSVEKTADLLDCLRFFYTNVWMPWDNDNDEDRKWTEKHLETRIRFCYDLRKGSMKRALAVHIRALLAEARYIQQRREYLELGLSDDEDLNNSVEVTDLMRLHLRLARIRYEVEILENPEMRHLYEHVHFENDKHMKDNDKMSLKNSERVHYIVSSPGTIEAQMALLHLAQERVTKNSLIQMFHCLQDVLNICNASDCIFLCPGKHTIKFLEYLNDGGLICGLTNKEQYGDESLNDATLTSRDDETMLLVFDGNYTLENLLIDCYNTRTGLTVKNGIVILKNCRIIGDGKSSTQEGIMCSGSAEINLENCVIENFATGIILQNNTKLSIKNSTVLNCNIGLDVSSINTKVEFGDSIIRKSNKCGVYIDSIELENTTAKSLDINKMQEVQSVVPSTLSWTGDCKFEECKSNIYIKNQVKAIISPETIKTIINDDMSVINEDTLKSDLESNNKPFNKDTMLISFTEPQYNTDKKDN